MPGTHYVSQFSQKPYKVGVKLHLLLAEDPGWRRLSSSLIDGTIISSCSPAPPMRRVYIPAHCHVTGGISPVGRTHRYPTHVARGHMASSAWRTVRCLNQFCVSPSFLVLSLCHEMACSPSDCSLSLGHWQEEVWAELQATADIAERPEHEIIIYFSESHGNMGYSCYRSQTRWRLASTLSQRQGSGWICTDPTQNTQEVLIGPSFYTNREPGIGSKLKKKKSKMRDKDC